VERAVEGLGVTSIANALDELLKAYEKDKASIDEKLQQCLELKR